MKIYSEVPKNWKDLQNKAARFLTELGYETSIEKNIQTAREIVNVDVHASNNKYIPNNTILCECKYWAKPVSKTIVHAFRTLVTDYGANYGIIISKSGFQSGSYQAVKNTNILLLNWEKFQDYFKIEWIKKKQFAVSQETKPLYDYVSVAFPVFFKKQYSQLTACELEAYKGLCWKHFHVAFHSSNLNYKDPNTNEFDLREFDLLFTQAEKEFGINFKSYEEYYHFLVENAKAGIDEFDVFFKEKLRRKSYE